MNHLPLLNYPPPMYCLSIKKSAPVYYSAYTSFHHGFIPGLHSFFLIDMTVHFQHDSSIAASWNKECNQPSKILAVMQIIW